MFVVYGVHIEYGTKGRETLAEFTTEEEAMAHLEQVEKYGNDPYYAYYGVEDENV